MTTSRMLVCALPVAATDASSTVTISGDGHNLTFASDALVAPAEDNNFPDLLISRVATAGGHVWVLVYTTVTPTGDLTATSTIHGSITFLEASYVPPAQPFTAAESSEVGLRVLAGLVTLVGRANKR